MRLQTNTPTSGTEFPRPCNILACYLYQLSLSGLPLSRPVPNRLPAAWKNCFKQPGFIGLRGLYPPNSLIGRSLILSSATTHSSCRCLSCPRPQFRDQARHKPMHVTTLSSAVGLGLRLEKAHALTQCHSTLSCRPAWFSRD